MNYETDHFLMTPGLLRFSSHFFISSNEVYDYIQQSELLLLTVDVSWSERERYCHHYKEELVAIRLWCMVFRLLSELYLI